MINKIKGVINMKIYELVTEVLLKKDINPNRRGFYFLRSCIIYSLLGIREDDTHPINFSIQESSIIYDSSISNIRRNIKSVIPSNISIDEFVRETVSQINEMNVI